MQIINSIYEKITDDTIICIGNFDGIHIVHNQIISNVVNTAKEKSCKSMVITFKQHPLYTINPTNAPKLLMNLKEKINIIENMGVDYLVLYDFLEVKNISHYRFVEYLVENYNMKKIICGFNFKFGHKNKGNIYTLKEMSTKYNFEIDVYDPIRLLNKKISSTKIRTYINYGEIEKANKLLGRFFNISGIVVKGKQLGRKLGFPTANIEYDSTYCIPQNGVYATITKYKDRLYSSMTNIGYNPTFKNKHISIETHIINFSEDLYGEIITINFIKKLRNEILFSDVYSLIEQLTMDKNNTEIITKKYLK